MSAGRLLGGRYQVGELLGYGGMAEVHHGRDLRLGRDVAIKMLRVDLARDATFQMRFSREAQNAAALNHPAIVAVYDTGEERGANGESLPYIVMEFVNGRTLKEVLTAEGPLMPRRALEISADICAALEFSHRHGIIHRDIKPGNVMLTQTGQVKVMDFGIARALASGASTMTQTSAVIGTAQYLSPEQARGEAVDARSDVYATGCVVYELLTGRPPFIGDNPVSVAYQHVREDPKPPSDTNRDVPPDVDAIVLKALSKNPLNRYQSAAEMRADLLRAAAGRPVLATPVLRPDPNGIVDTAPRTGSGGPRPTMPARVGDPGRRRASTWVMVTLTLLGVVAVLALGTGLYLTNRDRTITVPNVAGLTVAQATAKITSGKLKVGRQVSVHNTSCKVGHVVDTTPAAGQQANRNSTVDLNVCTGPGQTTVPLLTGETQQQAQQALDAASLKAVFKQVDGTAPAGTVVAVDPAENSPINVGETVTVSISKGNQDFVPSVVGASKADATAVLQQHGFKVKVVLNNAAPPESNGKVTSQNPPADPNKPQLKGSTVTIFVGHNTTPPNPPPSSPSDGPSVSPSASASKSQ
jgi:beta-lactam-binding protein with PASTA domain/predicted Ser/Thr protein kinase